MKLATKKSSSSLDGELVIVSRDNKKYVSAQNIVSHLLIAIENWSKYEPLLQQQYNLLNENKLSHAHEFNEQDFSSVLPRTWLFADGSAFIHHIKLVRMARKAALPETLLTVPLMYQAESGKFLDPIGEIPQVDFSHGTDFEAEVGVVIDHVPMGTTAEDALKHIKLILLINDTSLRGLIPEELAQGFGFFQSKPNKTFSPIAITPDELGEYWVNGRVHLPLNVKYNGEFFGCPNAKEMHFHFGQLIAHAAKTRDLAAGSVIGSGTVSNEDPSKGSCCLAEKRMIEQINTGTATTPFMKINDTVEIEMFDENKQSLFGRIFQKVVAHQK